MSDSKKPCSRRHFISNFANATALFTIVNSIPLLSKKVSYAKSSPAPLIPVDFPSNIEILKESFENWSGEIYFRNILVCFPKTPDDVVSAVNWAKNHGYKVRPRGQMHNWSPLAVGQNQSVKHILFVDTKKYLNQMSVDTSASPKTVTAQTGITMEALLTNMEQHGLGFTHTPAPGVLTLGGVLAINGHGSAIPAKGEVPLPGHAYGSISNLVLSLTAVVWDGESNQYKLKTFDRTDPHWACLMPHIGRTFITHVTLQAGDNRLLRCQSFTNISVDELFGAPGSSPRNLQNFIDQTGRIEAILFPFTDKPWLKVWSIVDGSPDPNARQVDAPYNYPFSDHLSPELESMVANIMTFNPGLTPAFGKAQYKITKNSLKSDNALDLYGWSKNLLLYIRPSTLRVTANGYAIVTNRNSIQKVIYEFYEKFKVLIDQYSSQWKYPMNGPIEIRVTGLDTGDLIFPKKGAAVTSNLSALRPDPDHPEWDVAIWLDVLTIPGTRYANEFYREMEEWMLENYIGSYATVRVEWSKGWGYTSETAWINPKTIAHIKQDPRWAEADRVLNLYDPFRLFTSDFLDILMP